MTPFVFDNRILIDVSEETAFKSNFKPHGSLPKVHCMLLYSVPSGFTKQRLSSLGAAEDEEYKIREKEKKIFTEAEATETYTVCH